MGFVGVVFAVHPWHTFQLLPSPNIPKHTQTYEPLGSMVCQPCATTLRRDADRLQSWGRWWLPVMGSVARLGAVRHVAVPLDRSWTFDVFHVFFHDFPRSEWTSICKLYKDAHKGTEVLFQSHCNQQGCGFDVRCWASTRARGFCNRLWIWIWTCLSCINLDFGFRVVCLRWVINQPIKFSWNWRPKGRSKAASARLQREAKSLGKENEFFFIFYVIISHPEFGWIVRGSENCHIRSWSFHDDKP